MSKHELKLYYHDDDGSLQYTIVKIYDCQHCGGMMEQTERDHYRGFVSCFDCGDGYWIDSDGNIE